MSIKKTDRTARANYRKKVTELRIELYPTDEDIKTRLAEIDEPKATYIKRLIRKDMLIIKPTQHAELSIDEQRELIEATAMEKDRTEAYHERYKRQIYERRSNPIISKEDYEAIQSEIKKQKGDH